MFEPTFSLQLTEDSAATGILARALARFTAMIRSKEISEDGQASTISKTERRTTAKSIQRRKDGSNNTIACPPSTLNVCQIRVLSSATDLHQDTNESYTLLIQRQQQKNITEQSSCLITAPTVYGAMHGMETLVQLVTHHDHDSSRTMLPIPKYLFISDRPRFSVRATMIDTARHWLSIDDVILPHIDAMSAAKMNVLHWHITDSQSWPYVSKAFPQLAQHGAYHPKNQIYTPNDIQRIVTYAKDRGIRIIPEIDTPGHVWAGLAAMEPPVLTDCYDNGEIIGTGPIDPTKETTFEFLKTLLAEVVPLFGSNMFSLGGDEVAYNCWQSNPEVVRFVKEKGWSSMSDLENYYMGRLLDLLAAQNTSTIMVWEEVFHNHKQNGLSPHTALVNVWQGGWEWCTREKSSGTVIRNNITCSHTYGTSGPWFGKMHVRDFSWTNSMGKAAAAGYRTVLSSPFYLNAQNAGSNFDEAWPFYYAIEPTAFTATDATERSSPTGSNDDDAFLTASEREKSVMGVEACMWTEWTNGSNFVSRFWPTAAAVAERGWSSKETTSIDDFRRRLFHFSCELERRGIATEPAIFGGDFFFENGTVCHPRGGVLGPPEPGCLPRFSSCASMY